MKYFLGLSSQYALSDTLRHTFAFADEYQLPELRAFLAAHYGATFDHVAVYANGRTALNVAIKGTVPRGSKIIITSLTCYAVVQAVRSAGCVPVFADVDKETLHFGAKELENALQGETNVKAIIVQNNLGVPVDITSIEKVAKAHKLTIIEDLAHCAGVRYADGREVGTVGRVAALSFGKGKSIDTVSGGAVVFTDPLDPPVKQPVNPPKHAENFRARFYPLFASIIRGLHYVHPKVARAFTAFLIKTKQIKRSADGVVDPKTRLTYWQCKLALRQLRSLPHRGRKPIRDFYLVKDRDEVLAGLEKKGYYFNDIWYDIPVAPRRYFKKADFHPDKCPVATELAEQIVNLPTWYDPAHLRSAKRLIMAHLSENPDVHAEDAEVPEEEMTDDEKRAKIRAERTARRKQIKADKKVKKEKIKKQKADGAPDEEISEDDEHVEKNGKKSKNSPKGSAKQKLAQLLENASKKVAETPAEKKEAKEAAKKKKAEARIKKQKANLAALEDTSDLLDRLDDREQEEEEIDEEVEGLEVDDDLFEKPIKTTKPALIKQSVSAEQPTSNRRATSSERSEPHEKVRSTYASQEEPTLRKAPTRRKEPNVVKLDSSPSGLRVAPRKLSERERVKLELEAGKKEKPSVF